MSVQMVNKRLRHFLLFLTLSIFIGVPIELWFTKHTESPVQFIPFILSGLGILALVTVMIRPMRVTIWTLRMVMALVALGGLFGIFEHFEHNLAFELEIRPNAVASEVVLDALSGANPFLAPGILALAAVLALAATYYHPVLTQRED